MRVREMSAKATNFADFSVFRCLFAFSHLGKATFFGYFLDFGCLFRFLPAVKASDFAGFPFFRCLLATILTLKATDFWNFLDFHCRLLPERSLLRSFSENHQLNIFLVTIQDQCMEINESSCLHVRGFDFHTFRS